VLGCRPLEEVEHELYHKAKVNLETFGGNVPCIHISAKFNRNIDLLLELILFESELRNLRGNFNALAEGRVVESRNITHKNVNEGLD
jgi:translation initiation factor IF-2